MSGFANQRLIPANTTLLQPGTKYFRISDALNYLQQAVQTATATLQEQLSNTNTNVSGLQADVTTLQGQVATLQGQTASLQNQINTINARLAAAGIP